MRHILIIRMSAMGDVAMCVPVLKKFTELYPEIKVTVLTRKLFAPIFTDLPGVTVFAGDFNGRHKGLRGLRKLSQELRALHIDAVADLHAVLRSHILDFFFKLAGIPVARIAKGRRKKKALTRRNKKIFEPLKSTHQRYVEVFHKLHFPLQLSSSDILPRKALEPAIKELTRERSGKWVGIAPFAQHVSKVYPSSLMEKVLTILDHQEGIQIFLFGGGKSEAEMMNVWETKFYRVIHASGKLNFEQQLSLISNLDAMVSMDSANGHLAANYGVPVVTLWGLTHPFTGFAPFAQPMENSLIPDLGRFPEIPTSVYGKKIPKGYEKAMETIPPMAVVEKVNQVLNRNPDHTDYTSS